MHKRIIEQDQSLGGDIGYCSLADGRERDRRIESQEHGRKKVAANSQVDAAPALSIQRSAVRPTTAFLEFIQIDRHRRAKLLSIEPAGYCQHGIADRLAFESADVH